MGENAQSLALVRNADGLVETFVRLDVPDNWSPPDGYTAIPDDELPDGWQRVPEPAPPIPESVTARQIRLWLVMHGYNNIDVLTAINSITDETQRQIVEIEWEYAPYVERKHPWLEALAGVLGLDAAAIDQAFREAAVL